MVAMVQQIQVQEAAEVQTEQALVAVTVVQV
jgi:hypothetical protein